MTEYQENQKFLEGRQEEEEKGRVENNMYSIGHD
jgi:hypothetical protein